VYDFLFAIELFSLALTVEALQGKTCQDSLLSGGGSQIEPRFQGEGGHPWGIFFGFYKTRYILLSDSAKCTVLRQPTCRRFDTIRACDRRTDRQT